MERTLDHAQLLAIDPGGAHCGMAWYQDGTCVRVEEHTPDVCVDLAHHWMLQPHAQVLIIEEFRLYPWMADTQSFSTFATVEIIGALKTARRWVAPHIELVMQPASIKQPTRKIAAARHHRLLAIKTNAGIHCQDAELHAYHYTERHTPWAH